MYLPIPMAVEKDGGTQGEGWRGIGEAA